MKRFAPLFFLLPLFCSSQTTNDYNSGMQKFQKFYNAGQGDSIDVMFKNSVGLVNGRNSLWTNEQATNALKELGSLVSYKFVGIDESDPQKVYVFQTTFSKAGKKMTSCTMDKDLAFRTFRLVTIPGKVTKPINKPTKTSKSS